MWKKKAYIFIILGLQLSNLLIERLEFKTQSNNYDQLASFLLLDERKIDSVIAADIILSPLYFTSPPLAAATVAVAMGLCVCC